MKLEKMRKKNKLILILFLIFSIIHIKIVNADEKNYIVAVVDNEPITFIDIKEKAKFIHYSRNQNSNFNNINIYFKESLETLINDKLIFKEAMKFNKNIMNLSYEDAEKYLLSQFSNSNKKINSFLKLSGLEKDTILTNYQSKLVKKFVLQVRFKNEFQIYNEEANEDLKKIIKSQSLDQIDFEEITIKFTKKDKVLEEKIIKNFKFLLNNLATFQQIINTTPSNDNFKIKGGRVGWKNINQIPETAFNKFLNTNEGEIIIIKSKNIIKFIRILAKRLKGVLSEREKQISLLKISYNFDKDNADKRLLNLKQFFLTNKKEPSCSKIHKTLNKTKTFKSRFIKVRLADFNENIITRINNIKINQLIKPFYFNQQALSLYICNVLSPKKIKPNKTILLESLLEEKVKHLNLRLIKKLKKDSVIVLKKDFK